MAKWTQKDIDAIKQKQGAARGIVVTAEPKKSKYNNTRVDGFDSIRERDRWKKLKAYEKLHQVTALQRQVSFILVGTSYRADFVYFDIHTHTFVVEDAKGAITDVYRIKKKMMKELYNITIQEV